MQLEFSIQMHDHTISTVKGLEIVILSRGVVAATVATKTAVQIAVVETAAVVMITRLFLIPIIFANCLS